MSGAWDDGAPAGAQQPAQSGSSRKGKAVIDAWENDDWESIADREEDVPAEQIANSAIKDPTHPSVSFAANPISMTQNSHETNRRLWDEANSTSVPMLPLGPSNPIGSSQPLAFFRPELKILKRSSPNTAATPSQPPPGPFSSVAAPQSVQSKKADAISSRNSTTSNSSSSAASISTNFTSATGLTTATTATINTSAATVGTTGTSVGAPSSDAGDSTSGGPGSDDANVTGEVPPIPEEVKVTETAHERLERERAQRQLRYNEARERLFGAGAENSGPPSVAGEESGHSTPSRAGSNAGKHKKKGDGRRSRDRSPMPNNRKPASDEDDEDFRRDFGYRGMMPGQGYSPYPGGMNTGSLTAWQQQQQAYGQQTQWQYRDPNQPANYYPQAQPANSLLQFNYQSPSFQAQQFQQYPQQQPYAPPMQQPTPYQRGPPYDRSSPMGLHQANFGGYNPAAQTFQPQQFQPNNQPNRNIAPAYTSPPLLSAPPQNTRPGGSLYDPLASAKPQVSTTSYASVLSQQHQNTFSNGTSPQSQQMPPQMAIRSPLNPGDGAGRGFSAGAMPGHGVGQGFLGRGVAQNPTVPQGGGLPNSGPGQNLATLPSPAFSNAGLPAHNPPSFAKGPQFSSSQVAVWQTPPPHLQRFPPPAHLSAQQGGPRSSSANSGLHGGSNLNPNWPAQQSNPMNLPGAPQSFEQPGAAAS